MTKKLNVLALLAASLLMLTGCAQKSQQSSAPPASEASAGPEAPAEAPPADLSAAAPPGASEAAQFDGQAPDQPATNPVEAAPPPPPPVMAPDPSGAGGSSSGSWSAADPYAPPPSHDDREASADGPSYGPAAGAPPKKVNPPTVSLSKPTPPTSAETGAGATVMAKKASGATRVLVYFATDRKIETTANVRKFGGGEVNGLYYGTVEVSIPPIHQVGAVESPQWWKLEFQATPDKHVVFQGFNLLSRDSFYTSLSGLVQKSATKEAFVFIHGFNTTFEDAARRTAQIEFDLKFDGAPIFYSWPSQGELSPLAYGRDATSSDRTVPRLKFFLKEVAQRTGAKRIHLIAHSMGNKAMLNALVRVADEMTNADKPLFNQIVLTAPDIDREVFLDIAQRIRKAGDQVTLYASRNDKALQASKTFNGFPRAGDATGAPVVVPGIFTIDASAVTTDYFGLNHDFFASQRTVLSDLRDLLAKGGAPDTRKLRKVKATDGTSYWVID